MSIFARRPAPTPQSQWNRLYWKLVVKIAISMSLIVAMVAFAAHNEFLTLAAVTFAAAAFAADILFVSRMPLPIRLAICIGGCLLINHWVDQPHSAWVLMGDLQRLIAHVTAHWGHRS